MVVMDTDTVTDTVMDMDMVTTLERDLLSHTTDTQPLCRIPICSFRWTSRHCCWTNWYCWTWNRNLIYCQK